MEPKQIGPAAIVVGRKESCTAVVHADSRTTRTRYNVLGGNLSHCKSSRHHEPHNIQHTRDVCGVSIDGH